MTKEEALTLDYSRDDGTAKLMRNYSELKTCGSCMHEEHNECKEFDIHVPETFTCLSFEEEDNE